MSEKQQNKAVLRPKSDVFVAQKQLGSQITLVQANAHARE